MARATTPKSKVASRVKTAGVKRALAAKTAVVSSAARASVKSAAASPIASKDDLRARIEKLERANATLRAKNKDLRLAFVEASEQAETVTLKLEGLERRAERQARHETGKANGGGKMRATPARGARSAATAQSGIVPSTHDEDEVESVTGE